MEIEIKGKKLELQYSIRMHILYENIVGESLDFTKLTNVTNILKLFWCNVLATLQANKIPLDISFDEFVDWVDKNGSYKFINEYAEWLAQMLSTQSGLVPQKDNKPEEKKKLPKGTKTTK